MKKKQKNLRLFAAFLVLLMTATLAGCGSVGSKTERNAAYDQGEVYESQMAPAEAAPADYDSAAADVIGGSGTTVPADDRKISLTAHLTLEALDFDATCQKLQAEAAALDGYVSASDIYGDKTASNRSATFTIKVPVERYSEFLESAAQAGNLVARSEASEDLTEQYVDVEARLKSLRAQETRLLELMAEAGELADLILIQEQLANVQYEIESYTAQQRYLEGRVSYSTVHATVQEVARITETEESYGARIAAAFRDGWEGAGQGLQALGIWLARMLPLLLLLAVILIVAWVALRRMRKKRAESPPAQKSAEEPKPKDS